MLTSKIYLRSELEYYIYVYIERESGDTVSSRYLHYIYMSKTNVILGARSPSVILTQKVYQMIFKL
jgi:hypothetical protein